MFTPWIFLDMYFSVLKSLQYFKEKDLFNFYLI